MSCLVLAHFRRPQALFEPRAESGGGGQSGIPQSSKGTLEFQAVPPDSVQAPVASESDCQLQGPSYCSSGVSRCLAPSCPEHRVW